MKKESWFYIFSVAEDVMLPIGRNSRLRLKISPHALGNLKNNYFFLKTYCIWVTIELQQ